MRINFLNLLTVLTLGVGCIDIDMKETGILGGGGDGDGADGGTVDSGASDGGDTGPAPVDPYVVWGVPTAGRASDRYYDVEYLPLSGRYALGNPADNSYRGAIYILDPLVEDLDDGVKLTGNVAGDGLGVTIGVYPSGSFGSNVSDYALVGAEESGKFMAFPQMTAASAVAETAPGVRLAKAPSPNIGAYFGTGSAVVGGFLFVSQTAAGDRVGDPVVYRVPESYLSDGVGAFVGVPSFVRPGDPRGYVAVDLVASPFGVMAVSYGGVAQFVGPTPWWRNGGTSGTGIPTPSDLARGSLSDGEHCTGTYLQRAGLYGVTCEGGEDGVFTRLLDPATGEQVAFLGGVFDVIEGMVDGVPVFMHGQFGNFDPSEPGQEGFVRVFNEDEGGALVIDLILPFGETYSCLPTLAGDGGAGFAVMCDDSNRVAFGYLQHL